MKRRKDSLNSLVTKSYLKSELKKGLGALEGRMDLKLGALEGRMDLKFDSLRTEIDENARKYRDEILAEFDKFKGKRICKGYSFTSLSAETATENF